MDVVFGMSHAHPVHTTTDRRIWPGRYVCQGRSTGGGVAAARVPSSSRGRYAFAGGRGRRRRDHRGSAAAAAGRANARACVIDLGRPERGTRALRVGHTHNRPPRASSTG